MANSITAAPEICVERWFNAVEPVELSTLRDRVVVIAAFQMLCPGCVAHGIPQAQRIHDTFSRQEVVVLGLHTVFEHHSAMTPVSLAAFLHEYKITFPVGVDKAQASGMPVTMQAYAMQGTPTLVLIDAMGQRRKQWFGAPSDLLVGADIIRLVSERSSSGNRQTGMY